MGRSPRWAAVAGGLLAGTLGLAPLSGAQTAPPIAALGQLTLVEQQVEQKGSDASWRKAVEGGPLSIGEDLRTGAEGVARIELPWMTLTVSPGSVLRFPDEFLLSAVLESGRAVVDAEEREALKLLTPEAEVRGKGRAVVRREGGRTLVSCLEGRFLVEGGGGAVRLAPGEGSVVASGRAPGSPQATPKPPAAGSLRPGRDCAYVAPGEALDLTWRSVAPAFAIEILPVGSDVVLLARDVDPPPARVTIPWGGAFRWRVAARDARGLEGIPSSDGRICVEIAQ
jgi:hypothetical protein